MVFKDNDNKLFLKFQYECYHLEKPALCWADFITKKDLGIIRYKQYYKIIDQKKWLLAKLKYGI